MPYRALIPGMLGDVPFDAGDIFDLSEEDAENWVTCGMLVATDDPKCPVTVTTPSGAIPTQPQVQVPAVELDVALLEPPTAIAAETPAVTAPKKSKGPIGQAVVADAAPVEEAST